MTAPFQPDPGFVLVPARLAVCVAGQQLVLTRTQFRILAVLMAEPGRVFHRPELVGRCIGTLVEDRTVDVHIKDLRRKLGEHGQRIETVRGFGYRLSERPPLSECA
jgi:DNA-binding response OmpR family regulator